ncbi:copine-8-like [Anneissia japonica]|uniref:copine-8-like n=1 Tax=Anneissia japonica TaxID=1529436 RepID=UPI0014256299|nr:copine-8-like [Anneissia japonica]
MAAYPPTSTFQPGTVSTPATKVEVSVACRNLSDKDVMSKSDPMCVLYTTQLGSKQYAEYERTEQVKNSLNPEFVHKFILTYYFEECQRLRFEIYDVDSAKQALDKHDFLGSLDCTLGEILGSSGNKIKKPLVGVSKKGGEIIISAEEVSECKDLATFTMRGHKLDKKDFLGKSDPYLVFYRCNEDNSYTIVHKTEVIKNTLDPTWRPFSLMVRKICNGDYDRSIKIECYDYDSDGSHDLIGEFTTNMRQLSEGSKRFELIHPKKKEKKKNYKHSGTIELTSCRIEMQPSFLDYIKGGTQLNFTVAIDFTASNGNPTSSNSLHFLDPYRPNHYAQAIQSVGEIVQDYDTDKLFPVLGFGAKIPPNGQVSHEFPVNFNSQNPFCAGIQGIMNAYQNCIRQVQLYGPTNFSPVINHVAKFAAAYHDGSNYFILLIITDGVISDMDLTKDAIIRASGLPMSIIIIGVGPAEFDAMEELDADKGPLQNHGKVAQRDIVQFVPFREYIGGVASGNLLLSQARLAKDVLAEVPDQFLSYMKKQGIKPNAEPQQNQSLQVQATM